MSADVLISPRISFSHDLNLIEEEEEEEEEDIDETETETGQSSDPCFSSSPSFTFTVNSGSHDGNGTLTHESSTADELFSDGKLLPIPIDLSLSLSLTRQIIDTHHVHIPVSLEIESPDNDNNNAGGGGGGACSRNKDSSSKSTNKIRLLKELLEEEEEETSSEDQDENEGKWSLSSAINFLRFRRSSSLNNTSDCRKNTLPNLTNIPASKLKLLSRSKSTGPSSPPAQKPDIDDVDVGKQAAGPPSDQVRSQPRYFRRSHSVGWAWKVKEGKRADEVRNRDRNRNRGGLIGSLRLLVRSNTTENKVPEACRTSIDRTRRIQEPFGGVPFRRSASLNCEAALRDVSSVIEVGSHSGSLGRSYSTGSGPLGMISKQTSMRQQRRYCSSSSSSASASASVNKFIQEREKKNFRRYYRRYYHREESERFNNPVLNLPSPYVSRVSFEVFGIGSLFCNGRFKSMSRWNS